MADNANRVANMARILAIVHIIVGSLLICLGIADRALQYSDAGFIGFDIWIGVWMCIAGGLGIPGTGKERSTFRNVFAGVFLAFSITSAVLGGIIIIFYSNYYYNKYGRTFYTSEGEMTVSVIILILGIVEFAIGVWASVCLCLMKPCICCYGNPQQGDQPRMVMVPVSGMMGNQPQFAQIATSGAMTTGFQPPFAQVVTPEAVATAYQPKVPPTYKHGGYAKLENDDSPVNT